MNNSLKKYIEIEIQKAKGNKKMYKNSGVEYINEFNFWTGYLNALECLRLDYKTNYIKNNY